MNFNVYWRFASKASLAKVIQHRPSDNTTFDKTIVVKNVPEALDLFGITKLPKNLENNSTGTEPEIFGNSTRTETVEAGGMKKDGEFSPEPEVETKPNSGNLTRDVETFDLSSHQEESKQGKLNFVQTHLANWGDTSPTLLTDL